MKNKSNYKAVFFGITILVVGFFYIQSLDVTKEVAKTTPYTLEVKEEGAFWIYEVYNEDTLFIRQEYIPAVSGRQGFQSKAEAERIGTLVLRKLSENKMPVVSIEDLKANNIRFTKR